MKRFIRPALIGLIAATASSASLAAGAEPPVEGASRGDGLAGRARILHDLKFRANAMRSQGRKVESAEQVFGELTNKRGYRHENGVFSNDGSSLAFTALSKSMEGSALISLSFKKMSASDCSGLVREHLRAAEEEFKFNENVGSFSAGKARSVPPFNPNAWFSVMVVGAGSPAPIAISPQSRAESAAQKALWEGACKKAADGKGQVAVALLGL